ncbi:tetratricopeptide repeat protein [Micromonospora sp. SL4-19]|uniref:tetratricopeptide repeat protein n=1 Tax=Micromonospora sp. SL4-19 TaxID=3399129 RepID=UPI003A4E0088
MPIETLSLILAAIALSKLISKIYFRVRYRKGMPVVLNPIVNGDDAAAEGSRPTRQSPYRLGDFKLLTALTDFLASDSEWPLAPGTMESAAPVLPTVAPDSQNYWVSVLMALAFARRPCYQVHMIRGEADGDVNVRIVAEPRRDVIGATTIASTADDLVAEIGCFVIHQIRSQERTAKWIPRWERWNSEGGYRDYRRGMALRDEGLGLLSSARVLMSDKDADNARRTRQSGKDRLQSAAESFRKASVAEPSNVLPRLALAAIMELFDDYPAAARLYAGCRDLWPENIETTYRLMAASHAGVRRGHGSAVADPQTVVRDLERRLWRRRIIGLWLRGWQPGRLNAGERRYWLGWFLPSHPRAPLTSLRSKRTEFLVAAQVAQLVITMRQLVEGPPAPAGPSPDRWRSIAKRDPRRRTKALFNQLTLLVIGRRWHGAAWLLHPEQVKWYQPWPRQHPAHAPTNGTYAPTFPRRRLGAGQPGSRIGWLAHYNAVCFLSIASNLAEPYRPWECTEDEWRDDCAKAALRELGRVLRDPYSDLRPSWSNTDDDLEPLLRWMMRLPPDHSLAVWNDYLGWGGDAQGNGDLQPSPNGTPAAVRPSPPPGEAVEKEPLSS